MLRTTIHLLTADDWLWTFQQVANPENKYAYKSSTVDPIATALSRRPATVLPNASRTDGGD